MMILDYGNSIYPGANPPNTTAGVANMTAWAYHALTYARNTSTIWEMWNEPNLVYAWSPVNVTAFSALANSIGQMLRTSFPEQYFVGPALAGVDLTFLSQMLSTGTAAYLDAITIHPYRSGATPPETITADYQKLRTLILQFINPQQSLPIASGEFGYHTSVPSSITINDTVQAEYFLRNRINNFIQEVPFSAWYDWIDDGTNASYTEDHFGVLYNNGTFKPAYITARASRQLLDNYSFSKRLSVSNSFSDYVALFQERDGDGLILVIWTSTTDASTTLNIPCGSSTSGTLIDMYGTTIGPISCTTVFTVTATNAPVFLVISSPSSFLQMAAAFPRLPPNLFPGTLFTGSFVNPLNVPVSINYTGPFSVETPPSLYLLPGQYGVVSFNYSLISQRSTTADRAFSVDLSINGGPSNSFSVVFESLAFAMFLLPQPIDPSSSQVTVQINLPVLHDTRTYSLALVSSNGSCCTPSTTSSSAITVTAGSTVAYASFSSSTSDSSLPYTMALQLFDTTNGSNSLFLSTPSATYVPIVVFNSTTFSKFIISTYGPNTTGAASSLALTTAPMSLPISYGGQVLQFTYNNNQSKAYYVISTTSVTPPTSLILSFTTWIYGDASGCSLKIVVVDGTLPQLV